MSAEDHTTPLNERQRLGQILLVVGIVGAVGALVAGVAGWFLAGRTSSTISDTLEPISGIVVNVADTIEASLVLVDRTTDAIESIESATRSTAETLESVTLVIDETTAIVGVGVADSLDSAVATLPALVDTGRLIDRTMRALSLVGVDYNPDIPLDESLAQLEGSLRPLPNQLRDQVTLLNEIQDDVEQIATEAESLATVLQDARSDLSEVEGILRSASANADDAATTVAEIQADVADYETLGRIVVVAVTVALLAAASAPLVIGFHYRENEGS